MWIHLEHWMASRIKVWPWDAGCGGHRDGPFSILPPVEASFTANSMSQRELFASMYPINGLATLPPHSIWADRAWLVGG